MHYNIDLGCSIYEERPLACQIEAGYKVFASSSMSKSEYYKKNAFLCNQMQMKAEMPIKFKVILS